MITSPGLRLGERYTLQDRLAVGGMGEVWTAQDDKLNRPVAVKVLRMDLAPEESFQARFRAEARTAAALSHGGIAAVFDYGEANGSAYLVMELVPGEPLSAMIARQGALGTDVSLQIVAQSARALHAAHRHGVVHRDIKPANLMVTPELRVKVTDFGIARPRDHEPLTATGQVMGTAHYLAPELARGEVASPLSDVYALGVVMYECLAGWRPFEGDNQVAVATAHLQDEPPPLPTTIPAAVRAVVTQTMAKDKSKRPQGANELARMLEDLRLRGLAGDYSSPAPAVATTGTIWPLDAATPPSGTPRAPRSAQHSNQHSNQGSNQPARTGAQGAQGTQGAGSSPQGHGRRSHPPTLQVPVSAGGNHGNPTGSNGEQAGWPPVRGSARHGPPTPVAPGRGMRTPGRPPQRRLSIPLVALLVLLALVLVGAVLGGRAWAGTTGPAGPPPAQHAAGRSLDTGVAQEGAGMQGSTPGDETGEGWRR